MSQQLEEMANSIFVNQVPTMWAGKVRLDTVLLNFLKREIHVNK